MAPERRSARLQNKAEQGQAAAAASGPDSQPAANAAANQPQTQRPPNGGRGGRGGRGRGARGRGGHGRGGNNSKAPARPPKNIKKPPGDVESDESEEEDAPAPKTTKGGARRAGLRGKPLRADNDEPEPKKATKGGTKKAASDKRPRPVENDEEEEPEEGESAPKSNKKQKTDRGRPSDRGNVDEEPVEAGPSRRNFEPSAVEDDDDDQLNDDQSDDGKEQHQIPGSFEAGDADGEPHLAVKKLDKGKGKATEATQPNWPRGFVDNLVDSGHRNKQSEARFKQSRKDAQQKWSLEYAPEYQRPTDERPTEWKGGLELGAGAFGATFVYHCDDENGLVEDRIVVKDTYIGDRGHWKDWTRWWGNPRSSNRQHLEIKIMQDVAPKARAGRCVEYRGHLTWDSEFMYRIIMTYCPLGSLRGAFPSAKLKAKLAQYDTPGHGDEQFEGDGADVPEPIIWKWLEDLATACQLMEAGMSLSVEENEEPIDFVIVHRDIKPDNIFLDLPSSNEGDWPSYPIATLGDWGTAFYTNDNDEENPMMYNGWEGTPGFKPVELATLLDNETKRPVNIARLGSPTNIWGIGQTMFAIMNRDSEPFLNPNYFFGNHAIPRFNVNAQSRYSRELRNLLTRCVQYLPTDRIKTSDLLEEIALFTGGTEDDDERDLASGMRAQPTSKGEPTHWEPLWKEHYKRGLVADEYEAELKAAEEAAEEEEKNKNKGKGRKKRGKKGKN